MFNDKETIKYEKQLRLIGIKGKQQQKKVLVFMYQLVTIAYGVLEEGQTVIRETKKHRDDEEKENLKDTI